MILFSILDMDALRDNSIVRAATQVGGAIRAKVLPRNPV